MGYRIVDVSPYASVGQDIARSVAIIALTVFHTNMLALAYGYRGAIFPSEVILVKKLRLYTHH
ncbi:MAG: hypothetical protein ACLTSS_00705 [Phocaeicola coprocola]